MRISALYLKRETQFILACDMKLVLFAIEKMYNKQALQNQYFLSEEVK